MQGSGHARSFSFFGTIPYSARVFSSACAACIYLALDLILFSFRPILSPLAQHTGGRCWFLGAAFSGQQPSWPGLEIYHILYISERMLYVWVVHGTAWHVYTIRVHTFSLLSKNDAHYVILIQSLPYPYHIASVFVCFGPAGLAMANLACACRAGTCRSTRIRISVLGSFMYVCTPRSHSAPRCAAFT